MGVGVSGCGKTRLLFDMARKRYALYFECRGERVAQADVMDFVKFVEANMKFVQFKNRRIELARLLTALISARLLILLALQMSNIVKTPKQWLMAQLDGACEQSLMAWEKLHLLDENSVNSLFKLLSNRHEKATQQRRLIALFDEAHTWMEVLEGEFPPASKEEPVLVKIGLQKPKKEVFRPMLSAAIGTLRFCQKPYLCGLGRRYLCDT